jgi:hypothetical protein
MRTKCLPLYLPAELYQELERRGSLQERDPIQEARFLIKQALATESTIDEPTSAVPAAASR